MIVDGRRAVHPIIFREHTTRIVKVLEVLSKKVLTPTEELFQSLVVAMYHYNQTLCPHMPRAQTWTEVDGRRFHFCRDCRKVHRTEIVSISEFCAKNLRAFREP